MRNCVAMACLLAVVILAVPTAGWSYGQPSVNLGFTSFVDGAPPAGPGVYFQQYFQYYTTDEFKDLAFPPGMKPDLDVTVSLTQLLYQSNQDVLMGGKWGINAMLPIVDFDLDNAPPGMKANSGVGDLLIGPYLQWDPIMGANGPIFMHRIELQLILPTGDYDERRGHQCREQPLLLQSLLVGDGFPDPAMDRCPGVCTTCGTTRMKIPAAGLMTSRPARRCTPTSPPITRSSPSSCGSASTATGSSRSPTAKVNGEDVDGAGKGLCHRSRPGLAHQPEPAPFSQRLQGNLSRISD